MNWYFFNGFWVGALSLLLIGFTVIWVFGNEDKHDDDDDYRYEPFDDNHDHFQPA